MSRETRIDYSKGMYIAKDAPAVNYLTPEGIDYYNLNNPPFPNSPTASAGVKGTQLDIWLQKDREKLAFTSTEGVTEVFLAYRQHVAPQSFLGGQVEFFYFDENLDPGEDAVVYRLAILGMTRAGFAFLRVVDYLQNGLPPLNEIDFRTVAADGHGPHCHIVLEAGNPTSMISESK